MKYYISGINPQGKKETLHIAANSPGEAVRNLRSEGYTDVTIHSDDFMGATQEHFNEVSSIPVHEAVSAKEYVSFMTMGKYHNFIFLLKKGLPVGVILIFVFRRLMEQPINYLDIGLVGLFVYSVLIVFGYSFFGSKRTYDRLIYSCSWYRWSDVIALVPKLKGKVPTFELTIRECSALAGLGRLDEALKKIEPFAGDPSVPAWMYYGNLPAIFYAAGLPDRILESLFKAHEDAPENSTIAIDLAAALVRFRRDIAQAQNILDSVDQEGLSEIAMAAFRVAYGLISIEEMAPGRAIDLFDSAIEVFERYAVANAMSAGFVDQIHAYLCLAHAENEDFDVARQHFSKAEPRLRAYRLKDILQRCQQALGETPASS